MGERQVFGLEEAAGGHSDPERLAFRRALSHYPTGVTVVTARTSEGLPIGITVNSFASVSLHPPLVLWSLGEDNANAADFLEAEDFAVNVLAADQEALARRFARSEDQPFAEVARERGLEGLPLLTDALSVFECRREAVYPGGDHTILIGRVRRFSARSGRPLVFHEGGFKTL